MPLNSCKASEVKSWLADDTALTHFESLELEMVSWIQVESDLATFIDFNFLNRIASFMSGSIPST